MITTRSMVQWGVMSYHENSLNLRENSMIDQRESSMVCVCEQSDLNGRRSYLYEIRCGHMVLFLMYTWVHGYYCMLLLLPTERGTENSMNLGGRALSRWRSPRFMLFSRGSAVFGWVCFMIFTEFVYVLTCQVPSLSPLQSHEACIS